MKKNKLLLFTAVLFAVVFISCKKNNLTKDSVSNPLKNASQSYQSRVSFAKILAKAIAEEPLLREKIKTEAIKQFDYDYDVLFQVIKNDVLSDNETVLTKLSKYAPSKQDFDALVNSMPLLTIYVAELPSFSPESWKTADEIPVVAIKPEQKRTAVEFYGSDGEKGSIAFGMIPSTATLVVKDNERVIEDKNSSQSNIRSNSVNTSLVKGSDIETSYLSKNGFSYSFLSGNFDNTKQNHKLQVNLVSNEHDTNYPVDPINVAAFKSGSEWQRDYIYYGIDPNAGITTGKFKNNYIEYIRSFSFIHGYDFENLHVGDDAADQNPTKNGGLEGSSIIEWTGGALEMRISILLNAKSGGGQELRKIFSVKTSDLFNVSYVRASQGGRPPFAIKYNGLTPKPFFPAIDLVPFDLDSYGTVWKFVVTEYDPSQEITNTITNTTVIANNFEISATGISKIGAKFGNTTTTTSSSVFQTKTTVGSDDLGEGILDFRSPVITNIQMGPLYAPGSTRPIRGTEGENYTTFEVTTGVISMSVEPRKLY